MVFRQQFAWVETTIRKQLLSDVSYHLFTGGLTKSGKSFLLGFFTELVVEKGASKVFILNCNKRYMLEEQLMFLFPNTNKEDMKRILKTKTINEKGEITQTLPKGFKVKVYVPISAQCPDQLPSNFIPFSIAVNDWDEENLQILYGDKDVTRIKGLYDTQIKFGKKKNVTYASLKNILRKFKNLTILKQTGFMGAEVTYFVPKAQRKTIDSFFGRMQQFNTQGIVSSEKFPYNLKNQLKKEILDQKTIVILDTEYLRNDELEHFVIGYFIKTIWELLDEQNLKHKIRHKVVLWFDEIRFLFPSYTEHKKGIHTGMSDLGAKLLTTGRHAKIEVWMSVQSHTFIPVSLLKNVDIKIVTQYKEKEDMDWVAEYFHLYRKDLVRDMFKTFAKLRAKGDYRFVTLDQDISQVTMQATPRVGWGNKLPRPRLSFYYAQDGTNKVPLEDIKILDKDKWSGIDLGIKPSNEMGKAKKLLFKEFTEGEKKLLDTIEKEREKRKRDQAETQMKIEEEENKKIRKVAELANLVGENYAQISAKTGITRDEARRCFGKALGFGLIYPFERIEKRKKAIKLLSTGKSAQETGLPEEEANEIIENAKKYRLLNPTKEESAASAAKEEKKEEITAETTV